MKYLTPIVKEVIEDVSYRRGKMDGQAEGEAKGMLEGMAQLLRTMLSSGHTPDALARDTGMSVDRIMELVKTA